MSGRPLPKGKGAASAPTAVFHADDDGMDHLGLDDDDLFDAKPAGGGAAAGDRPVDREKASSHKLAAGIAGLLDSDVDADDQSWMDGPQAKAKAAQPARAAPAPGLAVSAKSSQSAGKPAAKAAAAAARGAGPAVAGAAPSQRPAAAQGNAPSSASAAGRSGWDDSSDDGLDLLGAGISAAVGAGPALSLSSTVLTVGPAASAAPLTPAAFTPARPAAAVDVEATGSARGGAPGRAGSSRALTPRVLPPAHASLVAAAEAARPSASSSASTSAAAAGAVDDLEAGGDDDGEGAGGSLLGKRGGSGQGGPGSPSPAAAATPAETPMKTFQVNIVGLVAFSNILNSVIIFPFLPFFVHGYFPDTPTKLLGPRIGSLASSYFVGDALGSLWWGVFADKYGRKISVNLGLLASLVGILFFPFSPNYWTAVAVRFLSGALCGNNSLTRTIISEICDDTNQHKGFNVIGLSTGFARLVAPAIGGVLAEPASKLAFFKGTIFERYPYFLPCLAGAVLTLIGNILVTFWLDETLRREEKPVDERELGVAHKGKFSDSGEAKPDLSTWYGLFQVLLEPSVFMVMVVYFIHSFVGVISHEIVPMWIVNKKENHGFEFDTTQVGLILTCVAPFQVVFQAFAYPPLAERWKFAKLLKICLLFYMAALVMLPYTTLLVDSPPYMLWIAFVSIQAVAICSRMSGFTCLFTLLSNVADKEVRGTINGWGQAASSIGRALGPSCAGVIFAWSLNNGRGWPFNHHLLFLFLTACCGVSYYLTASFPATVDFQKGSAKYLEAQKKMLDEQRGRKPGDIVGRDAGAFDVTKGSSLAAGIKAVSVGGGGKHAKALSDDDDDVDGESGSLIRKS